MMNGSNITNTNLMEAANTTYSMEVLVVIVILMTLLSLLTVGGNIMVIYIYYSHKNLQIPKNYFILSLAIADVLIGIFSVNFYTLYLAMGRWPLRHLACNIWLSMDYSCCNASTLSLLAISIERYMSIRHALFHRNHLTGGRLKKLIAALWVLSFSVWFPAIFIYPYVYGERTVRDGECYIQFLYENPTVTIITAIITFYGPIVMMSVIYVLISYTLVKRYKNKYEGETLGMPHISPETSSRLESTITHGHNHLEVTPKPIRKSYDSIVTSSKENVSLMNNTSAIITHARTRLDVTPVLKRKHNTQRKKDYLSHKRAVTLLLLIIVAFAVTWFPYHLMAVIAPFCGKCIRENWWHFAYTFCYVNSLLNPFCYAFGNRHFKKYFKEIFDRLKRYMTCSNK